MDAIRKTFAQEVAAALAKYPPQRRASAVIELLYLAQAAYGRVTTAAVNEVAGILQLDPTHVRSLVGFYGLISEAPQGTYVVHLCTDLPCALRGAEQLVPRLCDELGTEEGGTSADGLFTLHTAKCVGACDRAPVMQVNLEYFHDLTPERVSEIVADLRRRAAGGPPRRPPFGYGPPSQIAGGAGDG